MSTLAELVKSRRERGEGIFDSLGKSLRDKIKEKFDPRQFLNQSGLLVALFPQLKKFDARKQLSKIVPDNLSSGASLSGTVLEKISKDTSISAKNSLVLPAIHHDFNVIRQNIGKLVKMEGGTPRLKADAWFKNSKMRESLYENNLVNKTKTIQKIVNNPDKKPSILKQILTLAGVGLGLSLFSGNAAASINRQPGGSYGGLSFNQLTREEQDRLLEAQFVQEGKNKSGSIVNRLNNPGAIKFAKWQETFGATRDESGFARFPSLEQGRAAQRSLWERYGNMPIEQAVSTWAPDAGPGYAQSLYSAVGRPTAEGKVTSDFGMRVHPITGQYKMHEGVDIAAAQGTPVNVTKEGKVSRVGEDRGYGKFVEVDHGGGFKTKYAHLSLITVSIGQSVSVNQEIGKVGSTGLSTGPHLHYELSKDGRKINPNNPEFTKLTPISPALTTAQSKSTTLGQVSAEVSRTTELMKPRDKDVIVNNKTVISGIQTQESSGVNPGDEVASQFAFNRLF